MTRPTANRRMMISPFLDLSSLTTDDAATGVAPVEPATGTGAALDAAVAAFLALWSWYSYHFL
jgi:hypothetical protein